MSGKVWALRMMDSLETIWYEEQWKELGEYVPQEPKRKITSMLHNACCLLYVEGCNETNLQLDLLFIITGKRTLTNESGFQRNRFWWIHVKFSNSVSRSKNRSSCLVRRETSSIWEVTQQTWENHLAMDKSSILKASFNSNSLWHCDLIKEL